MARNVETSRNAPCPCESGKKFKRCHGRYQSSANWINTVALLSLVFVMGGLLVAVLNRDVGEENPQGPLSRHYASIPGLALEMLPPEDRVLLLKHLNHTDCPCDCKMTIAECRNLDPDCKHSEAAVKADFQELAGKADPLLQPAH